jgi:hypothetical protein
LLEARGERSLLSAQAAPLAPGKLIPPLEERPDERLFA